MKKIIIILTTLLIIFIIGIILIKYSYNKNKIEITLSKKDIEVLDSRKIKKSIEGPISVKITETVFSLCITLK